MRRSQPPLALLSMLALAASPAFAAPPVDVDPRPAEVTSVVLDGSLVVLWSEGAVLSRHESQAPESVRPVVLGDRLGPGSIVECRAACRASMLSAGERLVAFRGPGRWLVETARLSSLPLPGPEPLPSRLPEVELLTTYREGPLPTLEALSSQPILGDAGPPLTLALLSPLAPVTRSERPEIRWHWPFPGGRFDLLVERVEGGEVVEVRESWRNLAGPSHSLWAPLEPGATYRVTVAHAGGATPISDARVIHVLAPSEAAAVDGALASLDALQGTGRRYRPEIDVLRARILESHGLWAEAEAVWTGLAILYPGRDDVLHQAYRLHARSLGRD